MKYELNALADFSNRLHKLRKEQKLTINKLTQKIHTEAPNMKLSSRLIYFWDIGRIKRAKQEYFVLVEVMDRVLEARGTLIDSYNKATEIVKDSLLTHNDNLRAEIKKLIPFERGPRPNEIFTLISGLKAFFNATGLCVSNDLYCRKFVETATILVIESKKTLRKM